MTHRDVQSVLDELGRSAGLGALPLSADGRLTLTFDNQLEVTLEHEAEEERLLLWALVAELGTERPPALLAELLDADFLGQGTGGATLAVEHRSGKMVLWQSLPVPGLGAVTLERTIETFVTAATRWRQHIATGGEEDAAPGGSPALHDHHHFLKA
jgi:hypothetical protein